MVVPCMKKNKPHEFRLKNGQDIALKTQASDISTVENENNKTSVYGKESAPLLLCNFFFSPSL